MLELEARAAALAADQFGLVTRRQLLASGMTSQMITRRVAAGVLVTVHPGVYRLAAVTRGYPSDVLAAQLWLEPHGIVSHRPAAWVHRLEGIAPSAIDITLRRGTRGSGRGVRIHATRSLEDSDVRRVSPFRLTTIERTLVDLGSVVSSQLVEAALDSALFQGLTTFERVARKVGDIRGRGRRGVGTIAAILDARDPNQAPASSVFETRFYRLLRNAGVDGAEFQFPVFDEAGFVARLDVAFPAAKVGVECHSLRWHSPRERVKRDARRQNRLTGLGWRVLYETYDDMIVRPEAILGRLETLLDRSFPLRRR